MSSKIFIFVFALFLLALVGCKSENATPDNASTEKVHVKNEVKLPAKLQAVMDYHGGMKTWNAKRAMSYDMVNKGETEKQYIDLWDRRELVVNNDYNMGYDGKNYWTDADTSVKTNPIFYKNLIFYFYAMPFVLADEGIIYEEVPSLVFEGVEYPGFKISYEKGVGVSPEDEYFIHYNAETNEMAWLGYTVTYYSKEKSTRISWIRYDDWQDVEGVKLPASMMWYKTQDNKPFEERSRRSFEKVVLKTMPFSDERFAPTPESRTVTE